MVSFVKRKTPVMKIRIIIIAALTLVLGLAVGYFIGFDIGWEKAIANSR
jgi:hypothetical protein